MPGVREFVFLTEYSNQNIAPESIVGQWTHYSGQTWCEAITTPKWRAGKIRDCLRLADSNPGYYFGDGDLSGISLTSYDGVCWYSNSGGNHRTIIGKFLLAMADSVTGREHHLPNVSTLRHHVDHECQNMYGRLDKFIQDRGIDIYLNVCSVPLGVQGKFEIRVFVSDNRWGKNQQRFNWISSTEFLKFAQWVIDTDGILPRLVRFKNAIGTIPGHERHRLYYPDMSGEFLSLPHSSLCAHMLFINAGRKFSTESIGQPVEN